MIDARFHAFLGWDRSGTAPARGARRERPLGDRGGDEKAAAAAGQRRGLATATASSNRARCGRRSRPRLEALDGRGAVLVRPSGTEPLVRVMVGGAERIRVRCGGWSGWSAVVERELGAPEPQNRPNARIIGAKRRELKCVNNRGPISTDTIFASRRKEPPRGGSFRLEAPRNRPIEIDREPMCGIVGYAGDRSCRSSCSTVSSGSNTGATTPPACPDRRRRDRVGALGRQPQPAAGGGRRRQTTAAHGGRQGRG